MRHISFLTALLEKVINLQVILEVIPPHSVSLSEELAQSFFVIFDFHAFRQYQKSDSKHNL